LESNKKNGIDLHIHSTASDGSYSPMQIISLAVQLELSAISITDHDTIAGVKEVVKAGIPPALEFISGVEISTAPPSFFSSLASFHMLGYGFDVDNKELNSTLKQLQHSRDCRNPKILERLKKLGFNVSMEEVLIEAGNGLIGRPHIAIVMLNNGMVKSFREAFDKYLGKGKPAYVEKDQISCEKAITVIKNAGGVSVLAHPYYLIATKLNTSEPNSTQPNFNADEKKKFEYLLAYLKEIGLGGIEVYYPEHNQAHVKYFLSLAEKYELLITGGSDFHGSINKKIKMGTGSGNLFVPYELFIKL